MNNNIKNKLDKSLSYDSGLDLFTWKISPCNRVKKGSAAGYKCKRKGYRIIQVDGVRYRESLLKDLFSNGELPLSISEQNNMLDTLNQESERVNTHEFNKKLRTDNKSGVVGVDWYKNKRQWRVRFNRNHVGYFTAFDDAVIARQVAEDHSLNHGGV